MIERDREISEYDSTSNETISLDHQQADSQELTETGTATIDAELQRPVGPDLYEGVREEPEGPSLEDDEGFGEEDLPPTDFGEVPMDPDELDELDPDLNEAL